MQILFVCLFSYYQKFELRDQKNQFKNLKKLKNILIQIRFE